MRITNKEDLRAGHFYMYKNPVIKDAPLEFYEILEIEETIDWSIGFTTKSYTCSDVMGSPTLTRFRCILTRKSDVVFETLEEMMNEYPEEFI